MFYIKKQRGFDENSEKPLKKHETKFQQIVKNHCVSQKDVTKDVMDLLRRMFMKMLYYLHYIFHFVSYILRSHVINVWMISDH